MQKNVIFLVLICATVIIFSGAVSAADVPSANFTADKYWGVNNVTVHFTDTSTGNPTSWNWDLGDGTTSTEQNPTHTYSTLGSYNVSLTATNSAGISTKTISKCINVINNSNVFTSRNGVTFFVANDAGVKYDMPNGVTTPAQYGGVYPYIPQTYYIGITGGGTNPIQLSTDPSQVPGLNVLNSFTNTNNQTGTFYVVFRGGIQHLDDAILLLAVNGTIADDFSVTITSSGYTYTLPTPATGNPRVDSLTNITYVTNALNETFNKSDFIYQQNWRPYNIQDYYPIYNGEDVNDPNNQFHLMFIDLNVGAFCNGAIPDEINNGAITVTYEFHNLENFAAFATYGFFSACNWGTGIPQSSYNAICGYNVLGTPRPVSDFTANATRGNNSLDVQFTDKSTNNPTSWSWDFGDGSTSTLQNPTHTYTKAGNYTVTLTASNANVGNTETKTGYITVLDTVAPTVVADVTGGNYSVAQNVTLSAADDSGNVAVYYTTDGSVPTTASSRYDGGILIANTTTLKFIAVDGSGNLSPVQSETYYIKSDVYLNVTSSKTTPVVGDTVTYTFKLGNRGPGVAQNVTYTYVIPEGLEYLGATVDQGTVSYDLVTRTLTWNLGDVAVGDPYLWLNLRVLSAGTYNLQPTINVGGYNPGLDANIGSLTVNAVKASSTGKASATVNAAGVTKNVPMQSTGMPLTGLVSALVLIGSGLALNRKK
jgi:uncharacterized repeat protein (TIGR01451 family)